MHIRNIEYFLYFQILYFQILYFQILYFVLDKLLIMCFGNRARWYQLHVLSNIIVTYYIFTDTIDIYRNPFISYRILDNHIPSLTILTLHIYHMLFFKLNIMDYFHHILFVGFGVMPTLFFINTNQIYMGYIACSGIPGIIEYSILSLYKNNKLSLIKQKRLNAILYNYIRYPMCIYGASINLVSYHYGFIKNESYYMTIYINILLFLNGAIFNQLTIASYIENIIKIKDKNSCGNKN